MKKAFLVLAVLTASLQVEAQTKTNRTIVLTRQSHTAAHTNAILVVTNQSLMSGVLISQSSSNIVISSFGEQISFSNSQIRSCDLKIVPAAQPAAALACSGQPAYPSGRTSSATVDPLAECFQPHSEDEMRTLLRTPEAQILLKSVADTYIGAGADPQTAAARESYYGAMQQFASRSIGISDIQGSAQGMLGQLHNCQKEMNKDPQAARWNGYQQTLQQFVNPVQTPAGQSLPVFNKPLPVN